MPQPDLPEPAHADLDSMLSRKFGKEVANYFAGTVGAPLAHETCTPLTPVATSHRLAPQPPGLPSQRQRLPLVRPQAPFHLDSAAQGPLAPRQGQDEARLRQVWRH